MTEQPHKATLVEAYERLAARDAGGGLSDHELESERERILTESETPEVAKRAQFERLYKSPEAAGGYRSRVLLVVMVAVGMGVVLALVAWWFGGLWI